MKMTLNMKTTLNSKKTSNMKTVSNMKMTSKLRTTSNTKMTSYVRLTSKLKSTQHKNTTSNRKLTSNMKIKPNQIYQAKPDKPSLSHQNQRPNITPNLPNRDKHTKLNLTKQKNKSNKFFSCTKLANPNRFSRLK